MARKKKQPDVAYVLCTCDRDMKSRGGFTWPKSGPVQAPDWSPELVCGQGLHGLLWGIGDGKLLSWADDAVWLVVQVQASACVDLEGKVKFPSGDVVFAGARGDAVVKIIELGADPGQVICGTATAGDGGTATAGYCGTATAGDGGTATAGYCGTATAGDGGTATAGDGGTATAGYGGTATAGYGGTATAGVRGTATAGYCGTATAGYGGTATAGDCGTATAGYGGTATAGSKGIIVLQRWDGERYRKIIGYVDEDGIEPDVAYRVGDDGKLCKVQNGKRK